MKNIVGLGTDDASRRSSVGTRPETDPGVWERDRIGSFLKFVQARRALYAPRRNLSQRDTRISVEKISYGCSAYLAELTERSSAAASIQKIGSACREFAGSGEFLSGAEFYLAVGALRAAVAEHIATLSALCVVESTGPAAAITPPDDTTAP